MLRSEEELTVFSNVLHDNPMLLHPVCDRTYDRAHSFLISTFLCLVCLIGDELLTFPSI